MSLAHAPEPEADASAALELTGISHRFGEILAVDSVDLAIMPGEILTLVGPSGCGKTTLLRLAAGLEEVQAGAVSLEDTVVATPGSNVPPERRAVGLMFQDFALFPHLDVAGNIAFGLEGGRAERSKTVERLLRQVRLSKYASAYPHTLSGGQQQRIALARALAPSPRVMLMDEPFSGLDANLRATVRDEALRLLREVGTATMIVTHDPEEALYLGDRVAVMDQGKIVQVGSPVDVYRQPANTFIAGFFGDVNRISGTVVDGIVDTPFGPVDAPGHDVGTNVDVLIRPEAVRLASTVDNPDATSGQVVEVHFVGRASLAKLSVPGPGQAEITVQVRLQGGLPPTMGDRFAVLPNLDEAMVFPADNA